MCGCFEVNALAVSAGVVAPDVVEEDRKKSMGLVWTEEEQEEQEEQEEPK